MTGMTFSVQESATGDGPETVLICLTSFHKL
jgi:hypothetical protein